jgi:homocysteine S-methyltransferase
MNNPLRTLLQQQALVILDGALATELERRGADLRDPLWSAKVLVENPSMIRQLHYDYLAAGADVITTASYQASFAGFWQRGIDATAAAALLRLSVELACAARDEFWADAANRAGRERPLVAASVGPYGACLADGSEYRGDYGLTVDELMAWHHPRLAVLAAAGADLLACETLPCLAEGVALARLLPEFPDRTAWLAFSCRDGAHIVHGEPLAAAAALAEETPQVVAVGVNCTPPRDVESLLQAAGAATSRPLLCYPNSGEAWDNANHCWVGGRGAGEFATGALRWRDAGARLIGGCCRTTPEDVRALRALLLEPATA